MKGAPADAPKDLELLKGITGWAQPGQLTALMGGSGAGKTTLMDCVAGRKTVGEIRGDITVNGHPKDQATWSRVMGYVEQMDIHTAAQVWKSTLSHRSGHPHCRIGVEVVCGGGGSAQVW